MATTQERWLNGVWRAPMWVGQVLVAVALALFVAAAFLLLVQRDGGGAPPLDADELEYAGFMAVELDMLGAQLTETGYLLQQPEMSDPEWRTDVAQGAAYIRGTAFYISEREGTGRYEDADATVDEAMATYIRAAAMMDEALATNDEAMIAEAFDELLAGGEILSRADLSTD